MKIVSSAPDLRDVYGSSVSKTYVHLFQHVSDFLKDVKTFGKAIRQKPPRDPFVRMHLDHVIESWGIIQDAVGELQENLDKICVKERFHLQEGIKQYCTAINRSFVDISKYVEGVRWTLDRLLLLPSGPVGLAAPNTLIAASAVYGKVLDQCRAMTGQASLHQSS